MAKSQTSAASDASQSLINQANSTMPGVVSGFQGLMGTAGAESGTIFNQAESGYTNQQQFGGYDPAQLSNLRSIYASMLPTGGYDPTQLANVQGNLATQQGNLAGMETTGGYDPAQLAKTLSGYGTMADTGGFSDADKARYLAQATSGTTTTASNLAAAASRNAAATGGNAGAALANIQRQAGQQQGDLTNAGLTSLNQQINANKIAGLGGLGTTEQQVAAARQGVSGLEQGVSGQQAGLAGSVSAGRQNVAGQTAGLESGVASGVQGANAGLAGLYNTATGQLTAAGQQVLQGLGLQFGTEAQGAQILQELSKNPGMAQTLFGDFTNLLSSLP